MKRFILICAAVCLCFIPQVKAFFLFNNDDSGTNKPPRLHVLLQKANDFIDIASDNVMTGDPDKAVENYKSALEELARVERENPSRASTAEFAPLRNKRAYCEAAIDSIRLTQINVGARPVAVTDTTELQRKYDEKHGLAKPEKKPEAKTPPVGNKSPDISSYVESAKDFISQGLFDEAGSNLVSALRISPDDWNARFLMAYVAIANKDYTTADLMFVDLLQDKPKDVSTLILYAAVKAAKGDYTEAERILVKAIRAKPRFYAAYYNMALVLLEEKASNTAVARRYYELGRKVGGRPDPEIERRLKGVK